MNPFRAGHNLMHKERDRETDRQTERERERERERTQASEVGVCRRSETPNYFCGNIDMYLPDI